MRILVTGGNGFLGRYTLRALLSRFDDARVELLVRRRGERTPVERAARALGTVGLSLDDGRVDVIAGDVGAPRLGLDPGAYAALADRVDRVLHCAASVRFDQDLARARTNNVDSTARVLAFARDANAGRLEHVSTAFVAGHRTDRVLETELDHDAGFKNAYERSKYEAELLLRDPARWPGWRTLDGGTAPVGDEVIATVLRPSLVVGESTTGETSSFHMIYWPMKLYARGWWRTMIGHPRTPIDVVPVDFVADATAALFGDPEAAGQTFHLAAGPARHSTVDELAHMTRRQLDGPRLRYVDPDRFARWIRPVLDPLLMLTRRGRRIVRGGRLYLPYFAGNPVFDTARADAALAPRGIEPPAVEEYFERLVEFAVATDFGRKPAGRPTAGRPTAGRNDAADAGSARSPGR